jgi:hypothetical protein
MKQSFGRGWLWVFTLCFLLIPALVLAQTETGAINGTVTDPTGAVIPNATVVIKSVATNAIRNASTNAEGIYGVSNLPPGTYLVSLEHPGFAKSERNVEVQVGGRVGVDFQLQVGKADTVVEISATALQVNTETQTLGATINTEMMTELPSINRDPYAFVGTVGSVSGSTPDGRGVGYAINGQRASSTNVLLDGTSVTLSLRLYPPPTRAALRPPSSDRDGSCPACAGPACPATRPPRTFRRWGSAPEPSPVESPLVSPA